MGLIIEGGFDLGCREGEKRDFEEGVLGLKRGQKE